MAIQCGPDRYLRTPQDRPEVPTASCPAFPGDRNARNRNTRISETFPGIRTFPCRTDLRCITHCPVPKFVLSLHSAAFNLAESVPSQPAFQRSLPCNESTCRPV